MKRRNTFRAALALLLILTLCMPAAASGFTEKLIAITFDDGPGAYTAQLLDELAARDVKATFFVSGYRAANYPETLKRMVSEGHQLASHTQNHENLNTLLHHSRRWRQPRLHPPALWQRQQNRPRAGAFAADQLVGRPGGLEVSQR